MLSLFTILPILIVAAVFYFFYRSRQRVNDMLKNGVAATGQLLEIHQTGTVINGVPRMALRVRVEQAGQPSREVAFKQVIDLGQMPRAGEQVLLMLDPKDPSKAIYAGLPGSLPGSAGMSGAQTTDVLSIAPALREGGKLGIGTILSITPNGPSSHVVVEVDSVIEPKYNVTIDQTMSSMTYEVGDRVYLLIDKKDPQSAALMPLSFSQGKKIEKGTNRLDPLVLDPQLKKAGRTGQGTILTCNQVPLGTPALEAKGFQRWHLTVHIVPTDGTPEYDSEQTITFTNAEKVARICRPGAVVPVRYDANDPHCFCTDSIAMGYPDPYKEVWAAYGQPPLPDNA